MGDSRWLCAAQYIDRCSGPQSSGGWPANKGTCRPTLAANTRDVGPTIGFLATFGDARRMATETRRAEEVYSSNGVGCPSPLLTQKRQKICKLPRFTKSGQEPDCGLKPDMFVGPRHSYCGPLQIGGYLK